MSFRLIRRGIKFHHFFEELDTRRFVIADHSGDNRWDQPLGPEHTDDGVLYIDFERKCELIDDYRGHYTMPLKKPNGELCSTVVVLDEIHWIERRADRRFGTRADHPVSSEGCFHRSLNLKDRHCNACGEPLL